jgi:hypothetical protein
VNPQTAEAADTVRSEVEIMKVLHHPNIVTYYGGYGPDKEGRIWILMVRQRECVRGRALR